MGLLDKMVTSGKVDKNFLILLYGPEKVGKTTFGSELPKPLFICGEDGTDQLDVRRIKPKNWIMLKDILRELRDGNDKCETVVLDTVDWLENLQLKYLIAGHHASNIREVGGGWGAYKNIVKSEWHNLFELIDEVREKKNICFLAHTHTSKFSDPQNSCEYDRYELKMELKEVSSVFKEYVDAILFANFETVVKKEKQTKKIRAYGDNARVLYAERTHAFDAGNRYRMPAEMEFSAKEVLKYIGQNDDDVCKRLLLDVDDILKQFKSEDYIKTVKTYIEKVKTKPAKLTAVINKLKLKLAEGEVNE